MPYFQFRVSSLILIAKEGKPVASCPPSSALVSRRGDKDAICCRKWGRGRSNVHQNWEEGRVWNRFAVGVGASKATFTVATLCTSSRFRHLAIYQMAIAIKFTDAAIMPAHFRLFTRASTPSVITRPGRWIAALGGSAPRARRKVHLVFTLIKFQYAFTTEAGIARVVARRITAAKLRILSRRMPITIHKTLHLYRGEWMMLATDFSWVVKISWSLFGRLPEYHKNIPGPNNGLYKMTFPETSTDGMT